MREYNNTDWYHDLLRTLPSPLSREEEAVASRDELVLANMRYAYTLAWEYHQVTGLDLMDLVQEANDGLIEAAERFDPERECKFITHAVWWVRQRMSKYLVTFSNTVRVPSHRFKRGETHAYISMDEVGEGDRDTGEMVPPLHNRLGDDEPTPLDEVLIKEKKEHVQTVVSSLDPRLAEIMIKYWGLETGERMTLQELGEEYGVTRERIRQLKDKALGVVEKRYRQMYGVA